LLGGAFVAAVIANFAAWRGSRAWAPALATAMFLAGDASYVLHRARLAAWEGLPPREARMSLRVDRAFPQKERGARTGLATVVRAATLRDLVGQRVYFSLSLRRGEQLPRGAR